MSKKVKDFSQSWKRSKKARKQRKWRYFAPSHVRHKLFGCHLSKELRKKYGKRAFPLRKEDSVLITKGSFKGKKGKVGRIDSMKIKVYIEGIQRTKKDGTKVDVPFSPCNLVITELNLEDKKRREAAERKEKK